MLFRLRQVEQHEILQSPLSGGIEAVIEAQGIEAALAACLVASQVVGRPLGEGGGEAQGAAAVDDGLAEAEAHEAHPVLRLLPTERVVVERAGDAGGVGVPVGAVLASDDLLDDDGHLLILVEVVGGPGVLLCPPEEGRRPDGAHRVAKLLQPMLIGSAVRDHGGHVDAGVRLVVGVLQEGGGADTDRLVDCLYDGLEVGDQLLTEWLGEEDLQERLVAHITGRDLLEVVLFNEAGELVGGEHHGAGDGEVDGGILLGNLGRAQDHVDEGEAASLAAERAIPDPAEEEGLVVVLWTELGDDALGALGPVVADDLDQLLLDLLGGAVGVDLQVLDLVGDGVERLGPEPAAELVSPAVEVEALGGDGGQHPLQVPHRVGPGDLHHRLRVAEDEGAEAVVVGHIAVQLHEERAAVLPDEGGAARLRLLLHTQVAAEDQEGEVPLLPLDHLHQMKAGALVVDTAPQVGHVADDAQGVVPILRPDGLGLLEGAGQHDLRPPPHPQRLAPVVERLQDRRAVLLDEAGVHHREERGVEAHRVLHQDDDLHIGDRGVVVEVHPILDELDHRQEDGGVALPVEEVVDGLAVRSFDELVAPMA